MGRFLYFEGASGISGDMVAASLLDLGASRDRLMAALDSLGVDGFSLEIANGRSHGIAGCDFRVELHDASHDHGGDCGGHHHHGHHHHHEHRNLADVQAIIDRGQMSGRARALARQIFQIVAEAEARAHGVPLEEVHFHEVGAIDSIVDIVASAVLFDDLDVDGCIVAGLTEGQGMVRCQHGDLPVPVPAVVNIARQYGIVLRPSSVDGEMVTPTGIAIAAALRTCDHLPPQYRIRGVGIGLGKRDFGRPNLLRAMIVEEAAAPDQIYVLECNIDDATGQVLGMAMERLLAAGARDVCIVPCQAKKNRPGHILQIIADGGLVPSLERVVFESTTAIGLRKYPVERTCMTREMRTVELPVGQAAVKRCTWDGIVRNYPEYESIRALAERTGLDFQQLHAMARLAAERAETKPDGD